MEISRKKQFTILIIIILLLGLMSSCASPKYMITEHKGVVTDYLGQLDNKVRYYYVQPTDSTMPVIGVATIGLHHVGDTVTYKTDVKRVN